MFIFSNLYKCEDNPVHASLFIDKYDYDHDNMNADWGGVVMIEPDDLIKVNGYSNLFWGWGKEDGDMATRIRKAGYSLIERTETGYYTMMPHTHAWNFRSNKRSKAIESNFYDKELVLSIQQERRLYDGLTSLIYTHVRNDQFAGYTKMYFQLKRVEVQTVRFLIDEDVVEIMETGDVTCTYVLLETEFYIAYYDQVFVVL